MRPPFWPERRQLPDASVAVSEPFALDPLDALDDEDDLPLEALEALLPDELQLQEVAEQTPYGEILLQDLIRRQLTLSVSVAAVFLVVLLGLPLMNILFPELMGVPVLGLPMAWLVLALLLYPFLWALALHFVGTAHRYDDEFTRLVK